MGKRASALVELPDKSSYATAFCIHENGLFVTNNHVVEDLDSDDKLKLVMNANEPDEWYLDAQFVMKDATSDLAVLKAKNLQGDRTLKPLVLATDPNLFETMNVMAFGFPFGKGLSLKEANYPSISVSVGKVTAIRKEKGKVELVQLDATLNPGNSGGPVLNDAGQVIGIVSFGVIASGVNFAIPVEKLIDLVNKPTIDVTVPDFASNLSAAKKVEVTLTTIQDQIPEPTVEFWIKRGEGKSRKFELKPSGKDRFAGSVLLLDPNESKVRKLAGRLEFPAGEINCKFNDSGIKIDGKDHSFASIESIDIDQNDSRAEVLFTNGISKKIEIAKLPIIDLDLGNYSVSIDLSKATRMQIEPDDSDATVSYIVIVKSRGKEICRETSAGEMERSTSVASAEASSPGTDSSSSSEGAGHQGILSQPRSNGKFQGAAKTVAMPGTITDSVVAGGGRYLLVNLGNDKKLLVFNIAKAAIEKVLPLTSEDSLIAGTSDHIVIIDRSRNIIEKYSIDGFKRISATKVPFQGVVKSMTAGFASQGPLLLDVAVGTEALSSCKLAVMDLAKLKEVAIPNPQGQSGHYSSFRDTVHVRSSANGRVFGMWATSHSPQGIQVVVVNKNSLLFKYEHDSAGHVVPSADGMHVFTGARGVFKAGLTALNTQRTAKVPCVPTTHPRFYVSLPVEPGAQVNMGSEPFKGIKAAIHEVGSEIPLANLPDLELGVSANNESWTANDFTIDKRVFANLDSNAIVSIPFSNDRIVVNPFNIMGELKKSDIDFFFIASTPPRVFSPGKTYSYQIQLETNQKGIKYELTSGPKGMEISKTGKLTWKVPSGFNDATTDVIVSVTSGETHQTFDSFTIYNASSSK